MFGFPIVCYLFLGGLGGAVTSISALATLLVPVDALRGRTWQPYRKLLFPPLCVGGACLVAAALCLLADAARPEALEHLLLSPRPTLLTVGGWTIVAQIALSLVGSVMWHSPGSALARRRRAISIALMLGGLAVVLYSAFYLASLRAVPFWHSPWLPLLFFASSYSAGCALIGAICTVRDSARFFARLMDRLAVADFAFVALEAVSAVGFCVAAALASPLAGSAEAAVSASWSQLLAGPLAPVWWGGFVGLGMVAPLALIVGSALMRRRLRWQRAFALAACAATAAGSFALRFVVIAAGAHPALGF